MELPLSYFPDTQQAAVLRTRGLRRERIQHTKWMFSHSALLTCRCDWGGLGRERRANKGGWEAGVQ